MASCAHCEKVATENIPSDSGRVCITHAIEFWTGLLAHAVGRREESGHRTADGTRTRSA
jgi:hypothetical protein